MHMLNAGLFTRGCIALLTLVGCKVSWGESSAIALVWMSGVGSLNDHRAQHMIPMFILTASQLL